MTNGSIKRKKISLVRQKWTFLAIVEGALAGNPMAYRALYDAFSSKVNGLVWRLLGADDEHDDVVQLAFVNIIASLSKVKEPSCLDAWVAKVTVNTVRKEIRKRRFRRRVILSAAEPARESSTATDVDMRLVRQSFYKLLDSLSAEYRIVIVLRYVEGYSLEELTEACDCSLATAKRRLNRAMEKFKKKARRDFVLRSWMRNRDEQF